MSSLIVWSEHDQRKMETISVLITWVECCEVNIPSVLCCLQTSLPACLSTSLLAMHFHLVSTKKKKMLSLGSKFQFTSVPGIRIHSKFFLFEWGSRSYTIYLILQFQFSDSRCVLESNYITHFITSQS